MTEYRPLPVDVRMSDYGYWIVTLSVAPGRRMSVMIAKAGVTRENVVDHALATLGTVSAGRKGRT